MTLLQTLRAELSALGDPERAAKQQAYMKSALPFHGVPVPSVRTLCRRLFADVDVAERAAWEREVRALWDGARFREERYAALALCGLRAARAHQTPAALSLYEDFIVAGAWWDLVDDVAVHRVGPILRDYPAPTSKLLRGWSRSDDLWKRRAAIIAQIGSKQRADLELLFALIEPALSSKEFFLR